jgi:hypothetical protein
MNDELHVPAILTLRWRPPVRCMGPRAGPEAVAAKRMTPATAEPRPPSPWSVALLPELPRITFCILHVRRRRVIVFETGPIWHGLPVFLRKTLAAYGTWVLWFRNMAHQPSEGRSQTGRRWTNRLTSPSHGAH